MPWIETESLSFIARHEADDTDCAQRTLDALEDLRLRLEERFDDVPAGITVIVHPTPGWLAAAHPFLPAARLAAAPAGRRYLAGWAMASELHVLNDTYLDRRAAGEDSLAALRGTAERLYVLASRLRRDGPRGALELAFDARFREVERDWREYLRRLTQRRLDTGDELMPFDVPDELSA